jgi:hypothetical protein
MEETLRDHIDIISSLNQKINNSHEILDETKKVLLGKISRLENELISKHVEGLPSRFNF